MDNWTLKAIQWISKALSVIGLGLKRDFDLRLAEQKLQSDIQRHQEISQVTAQIADDIRGPLMALSTLTHLSHEMSADKKELLKVAVSRIRGIINDLIRVPTDETSDLVTVLEPLVTQYKFSHPTTQWALHNHLSSAHVLVDLETVQLQRILSHLLDNAVEAVPENQASIEVTLMERADHYLLQIIDNGCGIPEELLPKVTEEGVSHGKQKRHGLGLFEARKTVEALGGQLQIRSREGVGTQVVLLFPKNFTSAEAQVM